MLSSGMANSCTRTGCCGGKRVSSASVPTDAYSKGVDGSPPPAPSSPEHAVHSSSSSTTSAGTDSPLRRTEIPPHDKPQGSSGCSSPASGCVSAAPVTGSSLLLVSPFLSPADPSLSLLTVEQSYEHQFTPS